MTSLLSPDGLISLAGDDDGGNKTTYVQLRGVATDVSDTTEDGSFSVFTICQTINGTTEH